MSDSRSCPLFPDLFSQSATSCGVMTNVNYGKCNNGTGGVTFPQLTVYDSMVLHNKSIKFYINLTETQVWNDDGDKGHDHRSAPCSDAAAGQGIMGGSEFPDVPTSANIHCLCLYASLCVSSYIACTVRSRCAWMVSRATKITS